MLPGVFQQSRQKSVAPGIKDLAASAMGGGMRSTKVAVRKPGGENVGILQSLLWLLPVLAILKRCCPTPSSQ